MNRRGLAPIAAMLATALLAAACAAGPGTGGRDETTGGRGVTAGGQNAPTGGSEPRHPGERDAARSAVAQIRLVDCARAAGWDLQNLKLNVSAENVLIGMEYRAVRRGPDAAAEHETVQRCLAAAGVSRP